MVPSMPEAALAAVPGTPAFTAAGLAGEIVRRVAAMPEPTHAASTMSVGKTTQPAAEGAA